MPELPGGMWAFGEEKEQPPEWGALDALREAGLIVEHLVAGGHLQRVPVEGSRNRNGWYVWHADGTIPHLIYGRWDESDTPQHWSPRQPRTFFEREQVAEERRAAIERYERERNEKWVRAAEQAQAELDAAPLASTHPYLERKRVHAHGLRALGAVLAVPATDVHGNICGYERISESGEKRYMPGSRMSGAMHILSEVLPEERVWVTEGYATAASVMEATGEPTVCAFSAGNLKRVALALRERFPRAHIWIAADHDASGVGQRTGREAAQAVGGQCRYPESVGDDWNDIHVSEGIDAVRWALVGEGRRTPDAGLLEPLRLSEFLSLKLSPQMPLLGPLKTGQLIFIASPTGVGKTQMAHAIQHSLSYGLGWGGWASYRTAGVMLIDGEMSAQELQERQRRYPSIAGGVEPWILCAALSEVEINLAREFDQQHISALMDKHDIQVLMLDNLMSLNWVEGASVNSDEFWTPIRQWLIKERAKGRLIIIVDHTNSQGEVFGTKTKTWHADIVYLLRDSSDEEDENKENVQFEVKIGKGRSLTREEKQSFEAAMEVRRGEAVWTHKAMKAGHLDAIVEMVNLGMSDGQIVDELGIARRSFYRWKKALQKEGRLPRKKSGTKAENGGRNSAKSETL